MSYTQRTDVLTTFCWTLFISGGCQVNRRDGNRAILKNIPQQFKWPGISVNAPTPAFTQIFEKQNKFDCSLKGGRPIDQSVSFFPQSEYPARILLSATNDQEKPIFNFITSKIDYDKLLVPSIYLFGRKKGFTVKRNFEMRKTKINQQIEANGKTKHRLCSELCMMCVNWQRDETRSISSATIFVIFNFVSKLENARFVVSQWPPVYWSWMFRREMPTNSTVNKKLN